VSNFCFWKKFKLCRIWICIKFGFKFQFAEKKIWKAFLFSLSGPKSISAHIPLAAQFGSLYFCAGPVSFGLSARYRLNPLIIFFLRSYHHPRLEPPRHMLWVAGSPPASPLFLLWPPLLPSPFTPETAHTRCEGLEKATRVRWMKVNQNFSRKLDLCLK
jgi:hypothetical protein